MAAAEARAAWQRAANRCFVQEDAKRAPKLAGCCPQPVQQPDTNSGNPTNPQECNIPNFIPLNWNPVNSNLPTDTQWWLQLQPNFGCQKALASERLNHIGAEVGTNKVGPRPDDIKKSEDPCEPPWFVSTAFMKQTPESGFEEFRTLSAYSPMTLKCRGNANNCLYEDKEFMEFKNFDPLFPKKQQKGLYEMHAPWEESKKSQPWWQVADVDGLANLVAERAMQNIENNDLPRPTKTSRVHGAKLNSHQKKDDYENSPLCAGKESTPEPYDTMLCSYSTSSSNRTNSSGGGWQHQTNDEHGGAQDSYSSTEHTAGIKPSYQNPLERSQLMDALRHSQTRAREAEMAAKQAYDEKDHVIKLLFRQASHLFACKQWLKMLQLENICLQLRFKEHQISTMLPELPWMILKEKAAPGQEPKDGVRKGCKRRRNKQSGLRRAVVFAVGVGIVGAGLLLGWTLGWLLPKL